MRRARLVSSPSALSGVRLSLCLVGLLAVLLPAMQSGASTDPWTWQNPLPQGNNLQNVSCPSATLCKAVGGGGTVLSWDGLTWSIEAVPTTQGLNGISCATTNACKAVGGGGTILSWDGAVWSLDSNADSTTLNDVSCVSATSCKAVGGGGTIRSWDGMTWSGEVSGTTNALAGVACPTANFCKAVGHDGVHVDSGATYSWNGSAWSQDTLATTNQLYDVSCSSPTQCKAVGLFGAIVSWDGANWTADTTPFSTLYGVACVSGVSCKIWGVSGIAGSWNGTTWSPVFDDSAVAMYGVSCVSPTLCKAVGTAGEIQSWNGTAWGHEEPHGLTSQLLLNSISCPSPTLCKATAASSGILSWNASTWSLEASPGVYLAGIACPSTSLCKAVGFGGYITSWNGTTWSSETSGTTRNLNDINCVSPTSCKAVGDNGTILSWNGTSWSADTSGSTGQFLSVSCPTTSFCKVVGNQGVTRSWNGTTWSADVSGTTKILEHVSCPSTTLCKAVAANGTIRSWNGSSWSADISGTASGLHGVTCPSATQCKAVGDGTIVSWDGSVWSSDLSPTANPLLGVTCVSTTQCTAVGGSSSVVGFGAPPPPPTSTPAVALTSTPTSTPTMAGPTLTPTPTIPASQPGPSFTVNTTADSDDGACDLLGQGVGNQDCTLREAINAANTYGGTTLITFNIPNGAGCSSANVCTIAPASTLPRIDIDLTIDGSANGGQITISGSSTYKEYLFYVYYTTFHFNGFTVADAVTNIGALFARGGTVTVSNSTFVNNYSNSSGGAIYHNDFGSLTVANCTFVGNSAVGGGALQKGFGSTLVLNSTFSGNVGRSGVAYAGDVSLSGGSGTVRNSIFASSPNGRNCQTANGATLSSDSNSLSDDSTCNGATVVTGAQIALSPLAGNGGPTQTMALGGGSLAIDAGDDSICGAAPVNGVDQRGYGRTVGAHCDAGAYESGGVVPSPTPTSPPTLTPTVTQTPTLTETSTTTATATATPTTAVHDAVVPALKPRSFSIPAGKTYVDKVVRVSVINADLTGAEGPLFELTASSSDCPAGTVGTPDFGRSAAGPSNVVSLLKGQQKSAAVPLRLIRTGFASFNRKAPTRCTLTFTASVAGAVDPTPENATATMELNVVDKNDPESSTRHESLIASIAPVKLSLAHGATQRLRNVKPAVVNADILPTVETLPDGIAVGASDGDCPSGTVGIADFDPNQAGSQTTAQVTGGKRKAGILPLTINAAAFVGHSKRSPARCTAVLSVSGPGGDTDSSNNTTRLVIEVDDQNDY